MENMEHHENKDEIRNALSKAASNIIWAASEDPASAHFSQTPARFAKMYIEELFAGYLTNCPDMKVFPSHCKGMVNITPINIYSLCPHHIIPWYGEVHISYVPDTQMAGLSKFIRVARWAAARMICQEDYTEMLADLLVEKLSPQGVMIVCKMKHMCMGCRGARAPEAHTITDAIRGVYKRVLNPREEFLAILKDTL